MRMDQAEKHELLIEVLCEQIDKLNSDLTDKAITLNYWVNRTNDLLRENEFLRAQMKPKRGRPAKKRGPGRPKKVKK